MSRHRNVRSMRYSDEYDGYDDVYGHSVEEDYAMSPSDAAFMYDRSIQPQVSSFLTDSTSIAEECEKLDEDEGDAGATNLIDSRGLKEAERVKLMSCLDDVRNVLGEAVPESKLIDAIVAVKFDTEKALDKLLSADEITAPTAQVAKDRPPESPKPLRTIAPKTENGGPDEIHSVGTGSKTVPPAAVHPSRFDVVAFLNSGPFAPIELVPAKISTVKTVSTVVNKPSSESHQSDNSSVAISVQVKNQRGKHELSFSSLRTFKLSKLGRYICLKAVKVCSKKMSSKPSRDTIGVQKKKAIKRFLFDSPSPDDSNAFKKRINLH